MSKRDDFMWSEKYLEYLLSDARIIAILNEGGTMFEDGLNLLLSEGRGTGYTTLQDDRERTTLEYRFEFCVAPQQQWESLVSKAALITITGMHDSGVKLENSGPGYMGYNEHGLPEGNFDEPPMIEVLLGPSPA